MAGNNFLKRFSFFGRTKKLSKQTTISSKSTVSSGWQPVVTRKWDGEKTPGELGAVSVNVADHVNLRYRSYDAAERIDTVKTISGKFFKYTIGGGLKLQSEPNNVVLKLEGVKVPDSFKEEVEARFNVFSNSKRCSQNNQQDLHDLANDAFSSAFLGGDTLVVLRIKKNNLTVQVIDGEHIKTPWFSDKHIKAVENRNNFISHGVEFSKTGEHIGYFVETKSHKSPTGEFEYIKAKGSKTGRLNAWMIYGSKHRINHHRGVPEIATILEKVNKLDRYVEAATGKAEEAANLIMGIEHSVDSTGENPFAKAMTKKLNIGTGESEESSSYDLADGIANKITRTTNKTVVNLPQGAKLSSFDTNIESNFEGFHDAIFSTACASVDLPPEVAMQKFNSNYSASRAAIGSWEYISGIHRDNFSKNFYKIIYSRWLELEVLKNKISAPGYISAINSNDYIILDSYSSCKFTGKKLPHIDPLKEVKAARLMLGDESIPLASREQVAEMLNLGDWFENFKKYQRESKEIPEDKSTEKE